MAATSWQDRVRRAREKRDASLAQVEPTLGDLPTPLPQNVRRVPRDILTSRELYITESYSCLELLSALRGRRLSVEESTRAFLRRAAVAHATTNCVTQLLWNEAITRAKELDALPEPKGSLFGMPFSLKEHLGMVGLGVTTNAAMVEWIGKAHGSTPIVDALWAEGCVFVARTTLPQAAMSLETNSNVYGRTVNPHNRNLTSGGSSGGEAALVSMRGSFIGIGTDIGGSIRCPAGHVGIYGFKPTSKRISAMGIRHYDHGETHVFGTPGPLSIDREGLALFMEVAIAARPWEVDPSVTPMPWVPYHFSRPLKIAVQWTDNVAKPHASVRRALHEVANACRRSGMNVVDWKGDGLDLEQGWKILTSLYWGDGGEGVEDVLRRSGEPVLALTKFILHEQTHVKCLSAEEIAGRVRQRKDFQARFAEVWEKTKDDDGQEVDVILCPYSVGAAPSHDSSRYWNYVSTWNLLDYPAAVFPVTVVDAQMDKQTDTSGNMGIDNGVADFIHQSEKVEGAPISLQLVGRRHCDEKVLSALARIEMAMGR